MAACEQIKHKRLEAMRDLSRKYAPTGEEEEWYKWITTPGEPPTPPRSLVAYDEHALPSFFAAPYMSDGFKGQLYFHEGLSNLVHTNVRYGRLVQRQPVDLDGGCFVRVFSFHCFSEVHRLVGSSGSVRRLTA